MQTGTDNEELAGQFVTDRPSEPSTRPARRLPAAMIAVLLLLAVIGYVISRGAFPFWIWLPLPLIALVVNGVLFVRGRKASARRASDDPARDGFQVKVKETGSPDPAVLPSTVIGEARAYGLEMAVGTSGAGAFQISQVAVPLGGDVAGFVVMYSVNPPTEKYLRYLLKRAWRQSTTAQEAGSHLLLGLDRSYDSLCAFVGIWKAQVRELTYFAVGFESLSAFNAGWPHRLELAIERSTDRGFQKVTFGIHRLCERERWLLYTKPLVDVSDPGKEPFNSVGIIQYAHDDRGMANDLWVDYLLGLGLRAQGGRLPAGSVLISLACSQAKVPRKAKSCRMEGFLPASRRRIFSPQLAR